MRAPADEIPADATTGPSPSAVALPLLENARLGRYRLFYEIASGGMASVFLASAEGPRGFEKLVAIKRAHPHLTKHEDFVKMFLDEARIAAQISHPNVGAVFDLGEADGAYFIAMEYLHGEPLVRVISKLRGLVPEESGALPRLAMRIVADACEGLHAAHELRGPDAVPYGVVHRDVTPQNVFVSYDGAVKVVDFGIARAEGRLYQTTSPQLRGKLGYLAPEVLDGKAPDRRVDVFGLSVCLWELLTLKPLFRRETERETLAAILGGPVLAPSALRAGIPPALDAIVLRGLARDPTHRYGTARDLGRDLSACLAEQAGGATMADLADWMGRLFPAERAEKDQRIALVRGAGGGAGGDPRRVGPVTPVGITPTPRVDVEAPTVTAPGSSPGVLPARGRSRRRLAALLAAALAAAGLAVVAGVLAVGGRDRVGSGALASTAPLPETRGDGARPTTVAPEVDRRPAPPVPPEPVLTSPHPAPGPPVRDEAPGVGVAEPSRPRVPVAREREATTRDRTRAASGEGTVSIATPPGWADIYLRGERVGRAPGRLRLPAGELVLRLRPYGELPEVEVRVQVPAGGEARVVHRLAH